MVFQGVGLRSRPVIQLAHVVAAAVAQDTVENQHGSALHLAGGSHRLDGLDVDRLAVAGEAQIVASVASLGSPRRNKNRNGYGLALVLIPEVVKAAVHLGLGEFHLDGFNLGDAELIKVLDLDQDHVIGKFVGTYGALVGVVAVAQAEQYERHSVYLTGA